MQQRAHPAVLQVFLHLPSVTTSRGSKLGASLATALLACVGALAAHSVSATAAAAQSSRSQPCRGANLHPTAKNWRAVDAATLCLVNEVRVAHGVRPLRANRELRRVAASQVTTMVARDYFSDDRPTGQTPLSLVAITRYPAHASEFSVGENIAWGTGSFTTPAHIVAELMASPPHREVMLSPEYRDAGVAVTAAIPAVLDAGRRGATYAIEFGMRLF
jgi:uncharacterized protein YkwD